VQGFRQGKFSLRRVQLATYTAHIKSTPDRRAINESPNVKVECTISKSLQGNASEIANEIEIEMGMQM